VLPEADLKVWLTADLDARARRRAAQNGGLPAATGNPVDVAESLARRDAVDSTRAASPAHQAADAIVVDATDAGIDDVVAICVLALCDALGVSYA
ncbi:MAG: cytidylate kinase, partial [Actinobacteria bacterium]|nr:cytidylate kinase [Actinomycetota bacterium]